MAIAIHQSKAHFKGYCCPSENFNGKNVFKEYNLVQYGGTGERTGGVAVFVKKGTQVIEGTAIADEDGHFVVTALELSGNKVVIGGIYGPSVSSDRQLHDSFDRFFRELQELANRIGTRYYIIAGDFNAKLDKVNSSKPRTVRLINGFINQHSLNDIGVEYGCESTWRRPHLPQAGSRLDYILVSSDFKIQKFSTPKSKVLQESW